ncbi:hypothetical protein CBR_g19238 [Chara braunii]|uniref:Aquaporin n=1 Tax=Chara braunii TaxID=69332 RepID=A0A388JTX8_CHABU|nr:hypothetical protein CBR_g19238 [Chara braunii]|eukprot:GBG61162.1 hypothetical protein CBR_g19238 [Chara braunii]
MAAKRCFHVGSVDEFKNVSAIRAALAEFMGLLIFNFISCGAVIVSGFSRNSTGDVDFNAKLVAIALAHGLAIGIMVAATAGVSGGHINPAVTFGMLLTGRISLMRSIMYWVAQIVGAIFGSGLIAGIAPNKAEGGLGTHLINKAIQAEGVYAEHPKEYIQVGTGFLTEVIITFILVFVIWGTAVDPRGPSAIAPLMIGLTILANHLVAVPITGASMNPARSFGAVVWSGKWADHWIYWIGPLLGAAIAALFYEYVLLAPPPSPSAPKQQRKLAPETDLPDSSDKAAEEV